MAGVCTGPGPCVTTPFGMGDNWVTKVKGLPAYISAIAHALRRSGHSESDAIATAVATVKRWAAGGGNVTAETRARAAKAVAEWEAEKAAAHALSVRQGAAIDLARMTVHRKNMLATAARHLAKARKARAAGQHKTAAVHYRAARTIMTDVTPALSVRQGGTVDLADNGPYRYRHGWIPLYPTTKGHDVAGLDAETAAALRGGSASRHVHIDAGGQARLTAERAALHQKIIDSLLAGHAAQKHPSLVMLGGGTASGKSSMLRKIGDELPADAVKLDPDEVKRLLPEYAGRGADAAFHTHEESSLIAKKALAEAYRRRLNVVLDGTGDASIESLSRKIDSARAAGYSVHGYYVTVPTAEAIRRSDARAAKTGRVVPHTVIREIHRNVSRVLPQALGKFDTLSVFDNTSTPLRILQSTGGSHRIVNRAKWDAFLAKG